VRADIGEIYGRYTGDTGEILAWGWVLFGALVRVRVSVSVRVRLRVSVRVRVRVRVRVGGGSSSAR
jgi:hypothetical protein